MIVVVVLLWNFLNPPRLHKEIKLIPLDSSGTFFQNEDGKWGCDGYIIMSHNSTESITIVWAIFEPLNATYSDGTSGELDLDPINQTFNQIYQPEELINMTVSFTGFLNKPNSFTFRTKVCISQEPEPQSIIFTIVREEH